MKRPWTGLAAMSVVAMALVGVRGGEGAKDVALYEAANHKYHARLKVDAKKKTATVDILDGKVKKLVPIKAKTIEMVIKGEEAPIVLKAVPRKDDPATATRYVGKNERFAAKIKFEDVQFNIKIDGKKAQRFTYDAD
jgi:hypothetical protein